MSNNLNNIEEKMFGATYPYYQNIKSPSDLGMSGKGNLSALGKDIEGLKEYVGLLVSGKSKASKTGQPLGNKFFLQTGAKCNAVDTNTDVDRYIYINNVPQGNIPFISAGLGQNFTDFRGLIPGVLSNLNALNPYKMMQAFFAGSKPDCQPIELQTIDINNNKSTETHYVALIDIQNMDPCNFLNKTNPITKQKCKQGFTTMDPKGEAKGQAKGELEQTNNINNDYYLPYYEPDDIIIQSYLASLGVLGIYILYRLGDKLTK
jgi:hypothetical protein